MTENKFALGLSAELLPDALHNFVYAEATYSSGPLLGTKNFTPQEWRLGQCQTRRSQISIYLYFHYA